MELGNRSESSVGSASADDLEGQHRSFLSEFIGIGEVPPSHLGFDAATGSTGETDLDDVYLRLQGNNDTEHDVTHLHELHHKGLNENTAWGAALWFIAAHPGWRDSFGEVLGACRATHECYATFMSISLAATIHPNALSSLGDRPMYQYAHARMAAIVTPAGGNHKQDLAATALALVCMQSPILGILAERMDASFGLVDVRWIDRPDTRLSVLADTAPVMMASLAEAADRTVEDRFGVDIQRIDQMGVSNQELDTVWDAWSAVVFDGLAEVLRQRGATVLDPHTHLGRARSLASLFDRWGIPTGFRVHHTDSAVLSDLEESVAAISRTRYPLRQDLWQADLRMVDSATDLDGLLALMAGMASPTGQPPQLVFHAREPGRLSNCYSWPPEPFERLVGLGLAPCVALRTVVSDPNPSNDEHVLHLVLADANQATLVLEKWGGQGPTAFCISSRCFVDPSFSNDWLNPLRTKTPVVVLLDTSLSALLGDKDKHPLLPREVPAWVTRFGIESTSFFGLLWHSEGQPFVGLYLADSLGTQLVENQIRDGVGNAHVHDDADWDQWDLVVRAVVRSLLTTESFVDLRAGEETVTLL